jgi:ganglioside GM2 activator
VGKFYIKVPCIDNVGSCNYGDVCKMWAEVCPKYFEKYGFPCTCPIPANTYSVPDAIIDISKKVPSKATGEFKLTANIGGDSHNLGCFKLQFKLKD